MSTLKEKALDWWNNTLTEHGRNQFPIPNNNDDIINYYEEPGLHTFNSLDHLNS